MMQNDYAFFKQGKKSLNEGNSYRLAARQQSLKCMKFVKIEITETHLNAFQYQPE